MGYMGFGMKKENYTRKPRKAFQHLKKLYGDRLDKFDHHEKRTELKSDKLTEAQRESIKHHFATERKHTRRDQIKVFLIALVAAGLLLWAFIALFRYYFNW